MADEKKMVEVTVKRTIEVGGKVFFAGRIQTDEYTAAMIEAEQKKVVRQAQAGAMAEPEEGDEDAIPEDFPHAKILADNDVTSLSELREMDHDGLTALKGIGDSKAEEILAALQE